MKMDETDRTVKSWDHPWTTDEIRKKRADWNLAGDSGLRQHLQQLSEKCSSRKPMTTANKTKIELNSLLSRLDETILFGDNITNISLSLATKQFIESRVSADDIEVELQKEQEPEMNKTKEHEDTELIENMKKSVRQGIAIMDKIYEKIEVFDSDSEDEAKIPIPSVLLRPKNRYRDRPLPYVIGSKNWNTSSKIGLESSSSESEEDREKDDSEIEFGDDVTLISEPNT